MIGEIDKIDFPSLILGILIGGLITVLILGIIIWNEINISKESAKTICQELSGNETIDYDVSGRDGKLVCIAPSYDNTQNIIFETKGES